MASKNHKFNTRSNSAMVIKEVHERWTKCANQSKLEIKLDDLVTMVK